MTDGATPITIKKYANRRLYDTGGSRYVTLADLARMVRGGVEFVVVDARSGGDITRAVLTQIIVDEEAKGAQLLPVSFLRQIIGLYGDRVHALLPHYLDHSMDAFARHGERLRRLAQEASDSGRPLAALRGIVRENLSVFERAAASWAQSDARPQASGTDASSGDSEALDALQAELSELQGKFEALRRRM